MDDRYAQFLIQELIPYVVEQHQIKLTDDPNLRGIADRVPAGSRRSMPLGKDRLFSTSLHDGGNLRGAFVADTSFRR